MIAVILVVIATFLAFSKSLPWQKPFEFKARLQVRRQHPARLTGARSRASRSAR